MRTIRINGSLERLLKEWEELPGNETYVFQNRNNSFYSSNTAVYWLNQILEGTNFPRITPHGFRHTHASLLAEAGADLKDIQDRLMSLEGQKDSQSLKMENKKTTKPLI